MSAKHLKGILSFGLIVLLIIGFALAGAFVYEPIEKQTGSWILAIIPTGIVAATWLEVINKILSKLRS